MENIVEIKSSVEVEGLDELKEKMRQATGLLDKLKVLISEISKSSISLDVKVIKEN